MNEIFEKAVIDKTENAMNFLVSKFYEIKPNIHEIMKDYLSKGYFGFEFMRDPFLWREECKTILENINKEIEGLGYRMFMNDRYHTVAILPSKNFEKSLKTNCLVGLFDKQYIHFTLDDRTEENITNWQEEIKEYKKQFDKKLEEIEDKLNL